MMTFKTILLAALLCIPGAVPSQEPSQSPPPETGGASGNSGKSTTAESSSGKKKNKPVPSFLIIGTVFNENALSFPGVQVRIRQSGGKKFKWATYTNSRGEFAVRVPPGYDYEVVTHVKKYGDQTLKVDSKVDVQQRLSIKLEPQGKTKTGAKP